MIVTFLPLRYIDPEVGLIVLLFRPVMVVPSILQLLEDCTMLEKADGGVFYGANIGLVLVGTFAFATNQGPRKPKNTRLNFIKLVR